MLNGSNVIPHKDKNAVQTTDKVKAANPNTKDDCIVKMTLLMSLILGSGRAINIHHYVQLISCSRGTRIN